MLLKKVLPPVNALYPGPPQGGAVPLRSRRKVILLIKCSTSTNVFIIMFHVRIHVFRCNKDCIRANRYYKQTHFKHGCNYIRKTRVWWVQFTDKTGFNCSPLNSNNHNIGVKHCTLYLYYSQNTSKDLFCLTCKGLHAFNINIIQIICIIK